MTLIIWLSYFNLLFIAFVEPISATRSCLKSEYRCPSGPCIDKLMVCDGFVDCPGKHDELNCPFHSARGSSRRGLTKTTFINCTESNAFDCSDGKCIDANLTCNGQFDCSNGQDEVDFCDSTPCESKRCSHTCITNNLTNRTKCVCHDGYQLLADGSTCEDIDECAFEPFKRPCFQECINTMGGYRCGCFEGFTFAIDGKHCIPVTMKNRCVIGAKEPYLLVLKDNRIYYRYFKCILEQTPINLTSLAFKITTFAYARSTWSIYVYNVAANSIDLIDLKNQTSSVFLKLETNTFDLKSLTYDDLTGNLYWIEAYRGLLKLVSTSDQNKTLITLADGLKDATSICLYQERNEIYIAIAGFSAKILAADLHGKNIRIIDEIDSSVYPTALYVDKLGKRLFWSDYGHREVYYVSLDGHRGQFGLKQLIYKLPKRINSMVVYDDKMYLAIKDDNQIIQVDLYERQAETNFKTLEFPKASDKSLIVNDYYLYLSIDFDYQNPCLDADRGNCSHICTLVDSAVSCLCPQGMSLDQTLKHCETKRVECLPGELLCLDGMKCFAASAKCNGNFDCNDRSDEMNCTVCPEGYEKCPTTAKCISKKWFCDGYLDCPDGLDEEDCSKKCEAHEFDCDGSNRCIPKNWVCDQVPDCENESDEANCNHSSTENNSLLI